MTTEQTPPTQQEQEAKITLMNQSEYDYDHALGHNEKSEADRIFGECWDWLNIHRIPFYRDSVNRIYKLGQKPT